MFKLHFIMISYEWGDNVLEENFDIFFYNNQTLINKFSHQHYEFFSLTKN